MRRRLGTTGFVLTLVLAIALGAVVGLGLRRLGSAPASGEPATPPPTSSSVLTAANVLTAADLTAAGWPDTKIGSVGNGIAQFAKACSIREPDADGVVTATYDNATGEYGQQSSYTFGIPPQATQSYRRIMGFYSACKHSGGSKATPMPTPPGVTGGIWHVTGGYSGDTYAIVVRVGDRIGWASLATANTRIAPARITHLATVLKKRLED